MRRIHHKIRAFILHFVDLFYPLFKRVMTRQMFRYAACGGGNTAINIFLYFIIYNFILQKQMLHLGFLTISSPIAAFLLAFCVTFPTGFYLSMYVVFHGSYLRRRIQLFRYLMVALACMGLNYVLLKLLVEKMGFYPTPALITTTGFVVLFSYVAQRHFSFRSTSRKKASA